MYRTLTILRRRPAQRRAGGRGGGRGRPPPPGGARAPRAAPPAEPLLVAPVAEVVPAALPGARPVRDLVVAVARGGQPALGDPIEHGEALVVRLRVGRAATPALEDLPAATGPVRDRLLRRVQTQLERIAGHVVGSEGDGGREIALPLGDGLAGPAEDEVDAHVQRGVANGGDGGGAVLRLVGPAERVEAASARALGADRDPRHAERAPCLEARAIERRRGRLHRGLARADGEGAPPGRGRRPAL